MGLGESFQNHFSGNVFHYMPGELVQKMENVVKSEFCKRFFVFNEHINSLELADVVYTSVRREQLFL